MSITSIAISGYRSLRSVILPIEKLNVVTGENGTGKSSIYNSLKLLSGVATGECNFALAKEGGMKSAIWAGGMHMSDSMRRGDSPIAGNVGKGPVSLRLGFSSQSYSYAIDLGLPIPEPGSGHDGPTLFGHDPVIKSETFWVGERLKRNSIIGNRRNSAVMLRDELGQLRPVSHNLAPYDSMMMKIADPIHAPELLSVRDMMRQWRFYHNFRTDIDAPARSPVVGTRTFSLAEDGSDLGPAIQTIREIGDGKAFDQAIEDAFPGTSVSISAEDGLFRLSIKQSGLYRRLGSSEISDGTLRFLMLAAAMFSPRKPPLLVLNEPENSLHPQLIPALSRMIAHTSCLCQVLVVTHSGKLVLELERAGAKGIHLEKEIGETIVTNNETTEWHWPKRNSITL